MILRETGPQPHILLGALKPARGRLTPRGRRALPINLLLERLWREPLKALHLTIHNNEDHSMAIQIRCRDPKGRIEKMEIKLEQPWTANENIDLATRLAYERARKEFGK